MDFKEFKEKYYGMETFKIVPELQDNKEFWKQDVDTIYLCVRIDKLIENIVNLEREQPSLFVLNKKILMYKFILEELTTLTTLPETGDVNEYCIEVEEAFYVVSSKARFIREMVDEGLKETQNIVLNELYKTFSNLPDEEGLDNLQEKLGSILGGLDSQNLKMISNIMEFNDPSLKAMKDKIYDTKVMENILKESDIVNNNEK